MESFSRRTLLASAAGAAAGLALSRSVLGARGQIQPVIAAPVALGALGGSLAGARVLPHIKTKGLRVVFACVVVFAGLELLRRVLQGGL